MEPVYGTNTPTKTYDCAARASLRIFEIAVAFTDAVFTHCISTVESTCTPPRKWNPLISPKAFRMMLSPPRLISSSRSVGSSRTRLSSRIQNETQMGW